MQALQKLWKPQARIQERRPPVSTHVHFESEYIIVYPIHEEQEPDQGPNGDHPDFTFFTGTAVVKTEPYVNIRSIQVGVEVHYSYQLPDEAEWTSGIIFQQYRTFEPHEVTASLLQDENLLSHTAHFVITIPSSLPTYEHTKTAHVKGELKAIVEYGFNSSSAELLHHLKPKSVTENMTIYSPAEMCTSEVDRSLDKKGIWLPMLDDRQDTEYYSSDGASNKVDRIKQVTTKHIVVAAHHDPNFGTYKLRERRFGKAAGVGKWSLFLWSDSFSVGSYVLARFKLENIPPRCTIFAFQLILNQTRTIVPIKEFIADNLDLGETGVKCPTESILLHTEGTLPKVSHPEMDAYPVLVKGRQDDGQDEQGDGQEEQGDGQRTLDWQSNQIRMPAEKKVRSSTFEGTITPLTIKHAFNIRVFFSIHGRSLTNEPIKGPKQTGEMRMLVIQVPVNLPSCICISERVKLPEYADIDSSPFPTPPISTASSGSLATLSQVASTTTTTTTTSAAAAAGAAASPGSEPRLICACCRGMEAFPCPEFPLEFQGPVGGRGNGGGGGGGAWGNGSDGGGGGGQGGGSDGARAGPPKSARPIGYGTGPLARVGGKLP